MNAGFYVVKMDYNWEVVARSSGHNRGKMLFSVECENNIGYIEGSIPHETLKNNWCKIAWTLMLK